MSRKPYGEWLRTLLEPFFPRTVTLWLMRIGLISASRSGIVSWSASKDSVTQQRAPPGQAFAVGDDAVAGPPRTRAACRSAVTFSANAAASPATGLAKRHAAEQAALIADALGHSSRAEPRAAANR